VAETSTLRQLASARGLLIGAAVAAGPLAEEARYGEVLAREFSSLTCENVMKPMYLQPERGRFDFAAADKIVAFAAQRQMAVRGHTLVWHRQNPEWLVQAVEGGAAGVNPAALLREHIHAVLSHYRQAFVGRVAVWDVVNEAVADDGGPRDTLWRRALGPDYVASAFRWAHAADPDVRLFYNDYAADGLGRKSDAVYALLRELKDAGVPVHGVGLQMHVGIGAGRAPSPHDLAANVARLAALGLEVHVTEMDVKLQTGEGPPEQRLEEQARVYGQTLAVCLSRGVTSFTLWGFTDAHSWIPRRTGRDDAPLPFDAAYRPKPAYHALVRALTA
jgi:endo-1,4-beta-xylanase